MTNKMKRECEDCLDECKRRIRCPLCKLLVCPWCRHHVHAAAIRGKEELGDEQICGRD